jgi:hypothetical protein
MSERMGDDDFTSEMGEWCEMQVGAKSRLSMISTGRSGIPQHRDEELKGVGWAVRD